MKTNIESDPGRWKHYNEMMSKREIVDFTIVGHCKRCGKRKGDHVTESVLRRNPTCCPFVS